MPLFLGVVVFAVAQGGLALGRAQFDATRFHGSFRHDGDSMMVFTCAVATLVAARAPVAKVQQPAEGFATIVVFNRGVPFERYRDACRPADRAVGNLVGWEPPGSRRRRGGTGAGMPIELPSQPRVLERALTSSSTS